MPDDQRRVTELDFRKDEFRNAKPEEYEFRGDGAIVRKDRWESAVQSIRHLVGLNGREFDIPDVVESVRRLTSQDGDWRSVDYLKFSEMEDGSRHVLRLEDGSVLRNVVWRIVEGRGGFEWQGTKVSDVAAFRDEDPAPDPAAAILGRNPDVLWSRDAVTDGRRIRLILAVDVVRLVLVRVAGDPEWEHPVTTKELYATWKELCDATVGQSVLDQGNVEAWESFRTTWEPIVGTGFEPAATFEFGSSFFVAITKGESKQEVLLGSVDHAGGSWTSSIVARVDADVLKGRRDR